MTRSGRQLSVRKKVFFSLFVLCVFYACLETLLALLGFRTWGALDDPYVGFQPGVPLFLKDAEGLKMQTNPVKLAYFNNQSFDAKKSSKAFRIFCLGGSTTFGHPYDYRTSFSNWLNERLRDADPKKKWEVINCGGVSYASYRVCLLMQELNQYEPDLYVVYTGHNEFLESRTYRDSFTKNSLSSWLAPIVSRSRTAAMFSSTFKPRSGGAGKQKDILPQEVDTILDNSVGPTDYQRDDKWHRSVEQHYRVSIERICDLARVGKARVVFVTPASNQRDCSPFKSEHGDLSADALAEWNRTVNAAQSSKSEGDTASAAKWYVKAAELDPGFAQGQWEAGHALLADGNPEAAAIRFKKAVDEDICPLRATSPILAALAEATRSKNVPLINYPKLLMEQHQKGPGRFALGDEDFLDHLHPTIDGHRLVAWAVFDQMVEWKIAEPQMSSAEIIDRIKTRVVSGIDSREQALALVTVAQTYLWAGKIQEALKITDRAELVHPGLSQVLSYKARLLEVLERPDEAMSLYEEAIQRDPTDLMALSRAGFLALKMNRFENARTYFATAVLNMTIQEPAKFQASCRFGLGVSFFNLEQWKEAKIEFQQTLKLMPDHQLAGEYLGKTQKRLGL